MKWLQDLGKGIGKGAKALGNGIVNNAPNILADAKGDDVITGNGGADTFVFSTGDANLIKIKQAQLDRQYEEDNLGLHHNLKSLISEPKPLQTSILLRIRFRLILMAITTITMK